MKGSLLAVALFLFSLNAEIFAAQAEGYWNSRFARGSGALLAGSDEYGLLASGGLDVIFPPAGTDSLKRWNGVEWEALHAGGVSVMLPVGNRLYAAGGSFSVEGGTVAIAVLEGGQWRRMGANLNGRVDHMIASGSDIIACGSFLRAGDLTVNRVARWDGFAWSALNEGLPGGGVGNPVTKLATDGYNVYAAWTSPTGLRVMRWNGEWSSIGLFASATGGLTNIRAMFCDNGDLYVAGIFSLVEGAPVINLAVWRDEAWSQWGSGQLTGQPESIVKANGKLYVSGNLTNAPSTTPLALVEMVSGEWTPRLSGVAINGRSMAVIDNEIYLSATAPNSGEPNSVLDNFQNIFRYTDADTWSVLLATGGGASRFRTLAESADGVLTTPSPLNNLPVVPHLWNGARFLRTTNALRPDKEVMRVHNMLASHKGIAYARASLAGDTTRHIIAAFRNGAWEQATGVLPGEPVAAAISDTEIVAALFSSVWGWTGSAWVQKGRGASGNIRTLVFHNGSLYAGGGFREIMNTVPFPETMTGLARWTGTRWTAAHGDLTVPGQYGPPFVGKLVSSGGKLFVGGKFTAAGGIAATNIASWNGAAWETIPGLNIENVILNMARSDDGLLAICGQFTYIDQQWVGGLALHDGTGWLPFGSSASGSLGQDVAMLWRGHDLYIVGDFNVQNTVPAVCFAVWHQAGIVLKDVSLTPGIMRLWATGATPPRFSLESTGDFQTWTSHGQNFLGNIRPWIFPTEGPSRFVRAREN